MGVLEKDFFGRCSADFKVVVKKEAEKFNVDLSVMQFEDGYQDGDIYWIQYFPLDKDWTFFVAWNSKTDVIEESYYGDNED